MNYHFFIQAKDAVQVYKQLRAARMNAKLYYSHCFEGWIVKVLAVTRIRRR